MDKGVSDVCGVMILGFFLFFFFPLQAGSSSARHLSADVFSLCIWYRVFSSLPGLCRTFLFRIYLVFRASPISSPFLSFGLGLKPSAICQIIGTQRASCTQDHFAVSHLPGHEVHTNSSGQHMQGQLRHDNDTKEQNHKHKTQKQKQNKEPARGTRNRSG